MKLDEFEIQDILGSGSYGKVYLAQGPDGNVALKVLRSDRMSPQMNGRFRAEVQALSQAKGHRNIVEPLTEVRVADNGSLYFALEYLSGGTLDSKMSGPGLSQSEVLGLSLGMARGLARVHELGYIHRDLCAGNVLLTEAGIPKMVDFGLCRPIEQDDGHTPDFWFAHGDPETAAPERLFHIESSEVGDAYSLGCLIYRLCTGRSVFRLSQLSFLHSIYTRQMEQFFRTCMGHGLPCPEVDFRSVYDHYLKEAEVPSLRTSELMTEFSPATQAALALLLGDLLEPDYWKRLNKYGSVAAVADILEELQ